MVKEFSKNILRAIPLAFGLVLTALSMAAATRFGEDDKYFFGSLIFGLVGVPLLFASAAWLLRVGRA